MDITGVPVVDSRVANHLIQSVDAARLMGAQVILTGLSPEVAQALVTVGVNLRTINTKSDLQSGIEEANRLMRVKIVKLPDVDMSASGRDEA
jgi:rsbT co-antagonist protein RsbR